MNNFNKSKFNWDKSNYKFRERGKDLLKNYYPIIIFIAILYVHFYVLNSNYSIKAYKFQEITIYNLIYTIGFFFLLLFIVLYQILADRNKWNIKEFATFKKYLNIYGNPEKAQDFLLFISLNYTFLIVFISFKVSLASLHYDDYTKYHDFFGESNFVILFLGLWTAVYGLLATIAILRNQNTSYYSFEEFLNEVTQLFDELNIEAKQSEIDQKIVIVDFHPFIGIKSLNDSSPKRKRYFEALARLTINRFIKLHIICNQSAEIAKYFKSSKVSNFISDAKDETIEDCLKRMSEQKNVSIWRTNEIGPFHFIITEKVAYEYLVIPYDNFSNKNTLVGSRTYDLTTISHLDRTADDIISNAIKLKDDLDLRNYSSVALGKADLTYSQCGLTGIKLRIQFEETEDKHNISLINFKKGFYPDDKDKFYLYNEGLFLEKRQALNKSEWNLVLVHKEEDSSTAEVPLFSFDQFNVDLCGRKIPRNIIGDNVFIKVKFKNKAGHITKFSHKTKIKLWI